MTLSDRFFSYRFIKSKRDSSYSLVLILGRKNCVSEEVHLEIVRLESSISNNMDAVCPYHEAFGSICSTFTDFANYSPYYSSSRQWTGYLNCLSSMKYEVEQNGDIDLVDSHGNNTLHLVCCEAYYTPHFIAYLLEFSSNVNAQNYNLQTPLHLFISNSHKDTALLHFFLEKGADPNTPDKFGNTSLHYLARSRAHKTKYFVEFAEMLIEFKANVNVQNKYGETPLHLAVRKGTVGFIPILLYHGASVFIKNEQNLTPFDTAYNKRIDNEDVFMEIAKYVIILNNSNVPFESDILAKIHSNESLLKFDEECKKEISKMQDVVVGQTNITLCKILKSSTRAFAKYLRNPEVMNSFQNNILQSSIIFENRLAQHFDESLDRKEAEDHAFPILMDMFQTLPDHCVNDIISYLGNDDLNKLK